jgi:hypothetical protein
MHTGLICTRPNLRRGDIMPTRCRSSWRLCLLCAGLPVHHRGPSSHNSPVRTFHRYQCSTTDISGPHRYLDVPCLISWLSARQYAPEGGFAGRTNKLVDGCYSHWVGGCWPLIEACLVGPSSLNPLSGTKTKSQIALTTSVKSFYSREGLIRYILCCCQDQTKRGGLRDKPSQ